MSLFFQKSYLSEKVHELFVGVHKNSKNKRNRENGRNPENDKKIFPKKDEPNSVSLEKVENCVDNDGLILWEELEKVECLKG